MKPIIIKLETYIPPTPQYLLSTYSKWLTNGIDNSYFYDVEESYLESTTNQQIIDEYANYIMGDGIYDETGSIEFSKFINEEDQRLAVTDFKIHGACAFQVIRKFDKTISRMLYVPTKTLGVNREEDITDEPTGYWYSFDWKMKTRFKPKFIPAFGKGNGLETEILYIKRHSPQPIFALPDWQSGLKYAIFEARMKDFLLNYLQNSFSVGKIININQGIPENEEIQEEVERAIRSQLSGPKNAGQSVVSFNENKDAATSIENVEITDFYQQFQAVSDESIRRIMQAHKVKNPALFGLPNPTGFTSAAEDRIQSLKDLYRSQINPARAIILNALNRAFQTDYPEVSLKFRDFEEFNAQNTQQNQ